MVFKLSIIAVRTSTLDLLYDGHKLKTFKTFDQMYEYLCD